MLLPVYDDWEAAARVVAELDTEDGLSDWEVRVLLVDDGSCTSFDRTGLCNGLSERVLSVDVLSLARNLGHQRAIAIGLAHLHSRGDSDVVVVMDADGEDRPRDVPRLLQEFEERGRRRIIFAERRRRSEGQLFRILYFLYRTLHRALTGISVRVGSFSVLSKAHLTALVVSTELWSHYAAAVFSSRLPRGSIPTERGKRYAGKSKMGFVGLVGHGLTAISVFSETVGVRLLVLSGIMAALAVFAVGAVVLLPFVVGAGVPTWAMLAFGFLAVIPTLCLIVSGAFAILVLSSRSGLTFLPVRDYAYFIREQWRVYGDE